MGPHDVSRAGLRRPGAWRWLVLGLVAAAGLGVAFLFVGQDDSGSAGDAACRAVVGAVRQAGARQGSSASLLEVVRQQAPVARAAAARDPTSGPVADAIEEMQVNLEAGRPWPSVVVLYERCG